MKNKTNGEAIERILNDFIDEMQRSHLSHYLLTVYEELGIQP